MSRDPITINGKQYVYDEASRTHRRIEDIARDNAIKAESNSAKDLKDMPSKSTNRSMKRKSLNDIDASSLHDEYIKTGSVHRAGEAFGICGESVRRVFAKHGIKLDRGKWSPEEDEIITRMYPDSSIVLADIARAVGRSENAVGCRAAKLGVRGLRKHFKAADKSREKMRASQKASITDEKRRQMSERQKRYIEKNGHPRGMLGRVHSEATRAVISARGMGRKVSPESTEKALRTKVAKYGKLGNTISRLNATWKAGWREIGGRRIYFRSRWEFNYGLYLELLKTQGEVANWEHEPETFWFEKIKRGCRSYLPDYRVVFADGRTEYHEVKGWMDDRSKTKIKRMAKYHPHVVLVVIQADWFKANSGMLSALIPEWETTVRSRRSSRKSGTGRLRSRTSRKSRP